MAVTVEVPMTVCGRSMPTRGSRAARLPRVGIERPHNVIGTSTVSAIQSGLYYGYAGLVDGILRRMIEELGRRPRVVATGGLAPLIATASEYIDEVDQTLTLDGLRLLYERNRGRILQG